MAITLTAHLTNMSIKDSRIFQYSGPQQLCSTASRVGARRDEQNPGHPPPVVAPSLHHFNPLDELAARLQRHRLIYESLIAQRTALPNPTLDASINDTVNDYNRVSAQYEVLRRQQEMPAQSNVSTTQHIPVGPSSASVHKRPAPHAPLEEETVGEVRRTRPRRTSESSYYSSSEEAPLSQWSPAYAIQMFKMENAALLQQELDRPTLDAFVLMAQCHCASSMETIIPRFRAEGFAGMLTKLREQQDPLLIAASGHLALTMLLYYCNHGLVLPNCCVDVMSKALATLKSRPEDCKLLPGTFAGLAKQATPIQEAAAAFINQATANRH
jgi:hypothetical protein